ncbi:ABC transporter ATP-binding protein/permease [Methylophaga sp. UBA2689]|jgi:ABC-type transport system involved in Fe-S cluster assembly fused permease/ATPase subunit|uniref:ABCB family ABC transporter ATP-binding protein/permease n=1 Tax=Methylophaga sp. UBA2689 TaxID=1946878 RepID=UPI0025E3ED37|nr:ABC transporter ATP-binding protein/permease [Methylophaga sp. UBA2689]|tara:strand:- start:4956 stop:6743 length:1788 start_codon:yes stop_codon:yes gene_type:complete
MRSMPPPADAEPAKLSWKTLKSLWPYLNEYRGRIVIAMMSLVAAKLATIVVPFILKYIVDGLDSNQLPDKVLALPLGLLLAYGLARLSTTLFNELRDTVFGRVTERAMRRVGLKVFQHLHALELDFHLNRRTGGLSRDIERGVTGVGFLLRVLVFNIVPTALEMALVIGILLLNYHVGFAWITLLAVISYVTFSVVITNWRLAFVREANQADSTSNTRAIDSLLNYETVKFFGNEAFEANRYDDELAKWELARRKNRLSLFLLNGGQALVIACAMTAMTVLAASQVIAGQITLGDFVLINAFTMQLFIPLGFLGFVYRELKSSMTNIERMFGLLDKSPQINDKPDAKPLVISDGAIEFDAVSFGYNDRLPILNDFSFKVLPKQKVAVVGSSGAGKSTLIKLLFRFYDIQGGSIRIDGQDIRDVTQASLRQAIGIVPQDTVLFNTTLGENVRYGRIDATDAEVEQAIKLAHLKDFITELPDGLNTLVGERGLKLSGGEKQRVAIARTILKRPPILMFDEATSSLDSHSERIIQDAIRDISKGQTSLVIAHRLSTVVDADVIVVMQHGQIVEQGTHESLLKLGEVYAKLWRLQQQKT